METFSHCPSCGKNLYMYVNLFKAIKLVKSISTITDTNTSANNFINSDENTMNLEQELNSADIQNICCRTRILSIQIMPY